MTTQIEPTGPPVNDAPTTPASVPSDVINQNNATNTLDQLTNTLVSQSHPAQDATSPDGQLDTDTDQITAPPVKPPPPPKSAQEAADRALTSLSAAIQTAATFAGIQVQFLAQPELEAEDAGLLSNRIRSQQIASAFLRSSASQVTALAQDGIAQVHQLLAHSQASLAQVDNSILQNQELVKTHIQANSKKVRTQSGISASTIAKQESAGNAAISSGQKVCGQA